MTNTYNPFEKDISDLETSDLLTLRNVHEGWYVDYKAGALNARSYAKAISAMANTYGGWIFIGVEEADRNNNVAGAFPGVEAEQTDILCQKIRQGVAEHLNPQPFFELHAVVAPGAKNNEKVLCIYVPISAKAPIIHSDGRIYRRVNDSSEPVPENNREVVEHLFKRVEGVEKFYEEWFERDPELSKAEERVTYLRLISAPDYWNDQNLWLKESTEDFVELLQAPTDGVSFSMDYNNICTQQGGFVCRQVTSDDAREITATFSLWRDLRSELWLPIPSFDVDDYGSYNHRNETLDNLVFYLTSHGHRNSTVLDFTQAFGAIDGYFALMRKFQKHLGYSGETNIKFKLSNAWRRVPVLNLTPSELGWEKYGVPIILGDTVASSSRGSCDAFHPINLHENTNKDHDSFLLSVPIFTQILMSIGFGVGSFTGFSELVNKAVMASYNKATKKGFSDISNASD